MSTPRSETLRARGAWLGAFCCGLAAALAVWVAARVLAPEPATAVKPAPRTVGAGADDGPERHAGSTAVLRSVYPSDAPHAPWVGELCEAFQTLPRKRRAECSGRKPGVALAGECTRMLDAAVASGALRVEPPAAERCVEALHARYADCSFTAARTLPPLPECTALWQGTLASGASCRSSLECGAGLHCRGAGPLDTGTCSAPLADGARCQLAIDALASYVPDAESDHPECEHNCVQGRCVRTEHAVR